MTKKKVPPPPKPKSHKGPNPPGWDRQYFKVIDGYTCRCRLLGGPDVGKYVVSALMDGEWVNISHGTKASAAMHACERYFADLKTGAALPMVRGKAVPVRGV